MVNPKNIEESHAELVSRLKKPGEDILASLTPDKVDLWHMVTLLNAEVGELTDAIKAYIIYNKEPLDMENVIEELGDIEFALEGLRSLLSIPRSITLEGNISKLSKRYSKGTYSDDAAILRADKQTGVN